MEEENIADEMILMTQKWLNKTYGKIDGFGSVPENGKTGWPTIYGLIRGLQVELGITSLVDSFGPTTSAYYDAQITPNWGNNLPKNVVYLIQGAFWCKGISPSRFDGVYSQSLDEAVKLLKSEAGFPDGTGVLSGIWAKALFDMSAFVLVSNGDTKIRSMQQWLNQNYSDYTGIMPCDGIYQRSSNEALIYALQAELGYSPDEATGSYGNGTTNATYTVSEGDSGNYVRIIQYGLFVNGYYREGAFDGIFSSYMGKEVLGFRVFMILPEYTEIADMTVIKGLLSSAGNTMRPAKGADTSTQLTPAMIQTLVDNDVEIIGRYLTGTVGVGADKRDKNLTVGELQNIFAADLYVFPIYQDGGWSIDYFTKEQGILDAIQAGLSARNLGIPKGTVIYFAVDVDIQGDDIPGTVLEYFKGIFSCIDDFGYSSGVYGTRNVCSKVIDYGFAKFAFVSDMSTGYSGNLGFPMPKEWAFDQFIEFTIGSGSNAVGIDNDAVSGRDIGFSHLENYDGKDKDYWINQTNWGWLKEILSNGSISWDGVPYTFDYGIVEIDVSLHTEAQSYSDNMFTLNITDGSVTGDFANSLNDLLGTSVVSEITTKIDEVFAGIGSANVAYGVGNTKDGFSGKIIINFPTPENNTLKIGSSIELDISFKKFNIPLLPSLEDALNSIFDSIGNFIDDNEWVKVAATFVLVVVLLILAIYASVPGGIIAAAGAMIVQIYNLFTPDISKRNDEE